MIFLAYYGNFNQQISSHIYCYKEQVCHPITNPFLYQYSNNTSPLS